MSLLDKLDELADETTRALETYRRLVEAQDVRIAGLEALLDSFESVALCGGRAEIVAKRQLGHADRRWITYLDGKAVGVSPTLERAFCDLPRVVGD